MQPLLPPFLVGYWVEVTHRVRGWEWDGEKGERGGVLFTPQNGMEMPKEGDAFWRRVGLLGGGLKRSQVQGTHLLWSALTLLLLPLLAHSSPSLLQWSKKEIFLPWSKGGRVGVGWMFGGYHNMMGPLESSSQILYKWGTFMPQRSSLSGQAQWFVLGHTEHTHLEIPKPFFPAIPLLLFFVILLEKMKTSNHHSLCFLTGDLLCVRALKKSWPWDWMCYCTRRWT